MAKAFKRPKPVSVRRQNTLAQLYKTAVRLIQQKHYTEAQGIVGQMLGIDEACAPAWNLLSACLAAGDSAQETELAARRALELDPNQEQASNALGVALMKQRRFQEAAVHLGAASSKFPRSIPIWTNLGRTFGSLRSLDRAEYCCRYVLDLDPDCAEARVDLANVLLLGARDEDAKTELGKAKDAGIELLAIRSAQLVSPIAASEQQILLERERFRTEVERLTETVEPVASLPDGVAAPNFYLAYHGLDDRPLQERWTRLLLKVCPSLNTVAPRTNASGDRIRVGFISSHLKNSHTISKFILGIMAKLPRNRFEVMAFDLSHSTDPGRLVNFAQKVVQCSAEPHAAAREIADAGLDVAFYPDLGMHPVSYRIAFSRLAPVQCTTWGHPVTTGIPAIDYFISSSLIEPENAEAHYSERLIQLSTLPTFYLRPRRLTNRLPNFPADWKLYACPQSLFKIHPRLDAMFAEILRRDPAGRLLLLDPGGDYANKVGDRIASKFPDIIDRVVFLNSMPLDELMGLMQASHVMLDTHPFGGGNTTYEALSLGTPIVTLPGDYMRGRVTLGCYRKMGFEECVVSSPEQYVERALRLANDADYRRWVSGEILARNHALYEDQSAVDEIAAFLERACLQAGAATA